MSKDKKHKFTKDWNFSPNGYSVITYAKDKEYALCDRAYELAKKEGVIEIHSNKKASKKDAKPDDNVEEGKGAAATDAQHNAAPETVQDSTDAPDTGADLLTET